MTNITSHLAECLANKPWLHSISTDQYGRLVVHTTRMDQEVSTSVPDTFEGKQVLLHFAPLEVKPIEASLRPTFIEEPAEDLEESLTHSIWRLKRICGPDELYDCLFEITDEADGLEVMTNISKQFPEVRETLERLYKAHGFDAILEEVER